MGQIAIGDEGIWVASVTSTDNLVRIDPQTNSVAATYSASGGEGLVALGHGSVWTTNPARGLVRLDPATGAATDIPLGMYSHGVATSPDSVWVADHHEQVVRRIDPATNQVVARISVGPQPQPTGGPQALTYGAGAIWVGVPNLGSVVRIDPASNTAVARIPAPSNCGFLAAEGDSVWIAGGLCGGADLLRIDAITNRVVHSYDRGVIGGVATGFGSVWVRVRRPGVLVRIDPGTNAVVGELELPRGESLGTASAAVGAGSVWVRAPNEVLRIEPAP